MEDKSQEEALPGSLKKLNSRRKSRINMDHWKDIKGKKLKDARKTQNPERKADRCKISIKAGEWNNAVKLYDFSTFSRKETSCQCVCNSCNTKYSDPISCIGGICLLFADILFSVVSLPKSTRCSCAQGTASCPVIGTLL
jgi:hypothetical protein